MTPNPNPSPELRELIDMLEAATLEDGVRVYEHDAEEIGIATMNARADLLAALSPQTLPAPGEVELREKLRHIVDNAIAYGPLQRDERIRIINRIDAQFAACLTPTLATVAAANDEGVAERDAMIRTLTDFHRIMTTKFDPTCMFGADYDRKMMNNASKLVANLPAAIRLLSQGGGK